VSTLTNSRSAARHGALRGANRGAHRGLVLLALANIRRERLRSALLVITIGLATLLFMTSLGSIAGVQAPVESMLTRLNASQALVEFDARVYAPERVVNWWKEHDEVASMTPLLPYVTTDGRPVHQGKAFGETLMLTERPSTPMTQDLLEFVAGEPAAHPAPGEIWLPTAIAESIGLAPGAQIEIATDEGAYPLTLSGIVVDPQYSSGFTNPARAWVGPGELARIYTPHRLQHFMLGIRLHDVNQLDGLWKEFSASFEGGFGGGYQSYQDMIENYSGMIRLLAMMILVFGSLSLLVALFIISSTISGVILANYRTFGVLKSLGYTPANVAAIFQLQFLLLGAIAVPLGIVVGLYATRQLVSMMLHTLGTVDTDLPFLMPALTSLGIMLGLIWFTTRVAGGRAGRIKAASSIRFGAPEQNTRHSLRVHLRLARMLPLTLVLGLKNTLSGGRRVVYDLLIVSLTAFVIAFGVNVLHSMVQVGRNLPFWGMDGSDVNVNINVSNFTMTYPSFKDYMSTVKGVEAMAGLDIMSNVNVPATASKPALPITGHVVDGDLDAMGFVNLQGHNPAQAGEVSLGVNLAKEYGVHLGDDVQLEVLGQPLHFTVSGIFQGSSNGGYWYRMRFEDVLGADPNFTPNRIGLVLSEGVDRKALMHDLEAQLGEAVDVEPAEEFVEAQLNQLVGMVRLVVAFMSLVFLVVTGASIFNSTTMNIIEARRQLGIYSALGYTARQIRSLVVNRSVAIALLATPVGLLAFFLFAQPLMSQLTAGLGMPDFPMSVNIVHTALAFGLIIALCMLSAWIPSRAISKIKARNLILE
jgi:putative ABC transport system permease protein